MKTIDNEERSALPAFICIEDIEKQNVINKKRFSTNHIQKVTLLESQIRQAYFRSQIYVTYRKNFITIKVANLHQGDRYSKLVEDLQQSICNDPSIEQVKTKTNLLFRVLG